MGRQLADYSIFCKSNDWINQYLMDIHVLPVPSRMAAAATLTGRVFPAFSLFASEFGWLLSNFLLELLVSLD